MAMVKCKECGAQISDKAEKCPSCGAPRKKGVSLVRLAIGVLAGFLLLGTCAVLVAPKSGPEQSLEVAQATAQGAAAIAKVSLGDELEFGKPTLKPMMGGMNQVLVEVRNKGSTGITCTATATFKKAGAILGTANGAINDVAAGATKTLQLMTMDPVEGFEEMKLETSACFPTATKGTTASAGGRAGDVLQFGKPTVKKMVGGFAQVLVEATNTTDRSLTCTVTATFKKGDEILNTADGAVNDVPVGGTKTAQLVLTGSVEGYDSLTIEGSACF